MQGIILTDNKGLTSDGQIFTSERSQGMLTPFLYCSIFAALEKRSLVSVVT